MSGYKPPKSMLVNNSDKTTVVITVTPELFKKLDDFARERDMTRVDVVRFAIRCFLGGILEGENGL